MAELYVTDLQSLYIKCKFGDFLSDGSAPKSRTANLA